MINWSLDGWEALAKGDPTASASRKLPGIQIKEPQKNYLAVLQTGTIVWINFRAESLFETMVCREIPTSNELVWDVLGLGSFQCPVPSDTPREMPPPARPGSCTWSRNVTALLPHRVCQHTFIHQGFLCAWACLESRLTCLSNTLIWSMNI